MFLNLRDFNFMFPNYEDYKIPMWSDWKETKSEAILSIAVPGYEKEDFDLYVEDKKLYLKINAEKLQSLYSIIGISENFKYALELAEAEYKSGVLKITIPKVVKEQKKIKVS